MSGTIPADLELYMPFDVEANPGKDYSGKGHDVYNISSDIFWNSTGGHDGKGVYEFDTTSNQVLSLSNPITLSSTDEWSISMWVKKKADDPHGYVIGEVGTAVNYIYMGQSGVYFYGAVAQTLFSYDPDISWHHYTFSSYGGYMTLYVDGEPIATKNVDTSFYIDSIGDTDSGINNANSIIDEIILWNTTLTRSQARLLYENKTNIISSALTDYNETWYAEVTPNNGTQDGNSGLATPAGDGLGAPPVDGPVSNGEMEDGSRLGGGAPGAGAPASR